MTDSLNPWTSGTSERRDRQTSLLSSLTPADTTFFKDWLVSSGWSRLSTGDVGELFQFGDSAVAIPRDLWRDPVVAGGVAERVARAMSRDLADVLKRLVSPLTDRIEMRLKGDELPSGRVPLGAASEALRNGRRLLSASGTSAISPGWSIARRYRPEAQELARDAELAHTEDGSFVFPLFVTLDRADNPRLDYDADSVIPEPYERRVTRMLATGLATAIRLSGESVDHLDDNDLDSAASVGVSREMCVSLDELLRNPSVDEVGINFEWSTAFGSTESLPRSVQVHRESRPQLRRLARRLARPEPIHAEVYSGPILEIGHGEEVGFHFVLDTYFRERKSKLRVSLTEEQHDRAIGWYRDRATVIVQGDATQMKSGLLMDAARRIDAWSDTRF